MVIFHSYASLPEGSQNYGKSPIFMGNYEWGIFNSYVKLPEGKSTKKTGISKFGNNHVS